MSWLICGTVPDKDLPLLEGRAQWEKGGLKVNGYELATVRGTPALAAASCIASEVLGIPQPHLMLAGDQGDGEGSFKVYERICESLELFAMTGISFHYLLPDIDWQVKIYMGLEALEERPLLVADAGYMYAVKMSGNASFFDLFTPDAGELAFLADEKAPHPFYTRGFLLADEGNTAETIARAYKNNDAAQNLLVKGRVDYIVGKGKIIKEIDSPSCPAMEAIGGTGDTITGIVSSLLDAGYPMGEACTLAAMANRLMAEKYKPNPATQVVELLNCLPEALEEALKTFKED